jgi:hypothetical protein
VTSDQPEGDRNKPEPLQLELPAPRRQSASREAAPRADPDRRRRVAAVIGALLVVLVACIAVYELALPWWVRRACIDDAQAQGIDLVVDEVRVDASGFRLTGVTATATAIPGARVVAPEIVVETSGLRPQKLTAIGAELTLDGRWNAVAANLASWRARASAGEGRGWAPATLVADGSRVVWQGLMGENARVEATGVHMDVVWKGRDAAVHAASDNVTLAVPNGTLGPWRVDLDRSPGASRVRVALDPGVPDASTILVVGTDDATTSVDAVVPRSSVTRLGIPLSLLGLSGKNVQLAATIHYAKLGPRADASSKGGLYGLAASAILRPLDVAWEVTASGDPKAGIDLKQARLAVGPLVGVGRGTLKTFDDGFRVDLAWHADPVPCSAFDAPLGPGQPFDIAYQLRKLAETAGLAKVAGNVSASGTLAFDSRDLGATAMAFQPESTCQVALFGSP